MTKSSDTESAFPESTAPQAPTEISDFWDLAYRAGDHLEHWESPHPPAELAALVAAEILTPGATVLDVGCGSGSETLFLAQCGFRAIGVDRSSEALRIARQRSEKAALAVEWRRGDAFDLPLMDNSVDGVIDRGCFHLIPPRDRQPLFDKIYQSLNWGGAFVLFEKVRGPDARFQDILTSLYNDFKVRQGFSPDEIISKTASLKGVLEPFTTAGNFGLLERAGFVDVMPVMKYMSFEGYLAIK